MDPIYKKLAIILDHIPNGFPETDSGVELQILARLFTPQEALTACSLSLEPRSAHAVANRMGTSERDAFLTLKAMFKKGLIDIERGSQGLLFKLMPFIVGFYERQNAQIDKDFALLFEQYHREALHRIMSMKPSVHRIIPVEKTIPVNIEVMPYERASHYLENAKSWGVLNCICRIQKRLIGEGCHHTVENCLVFSKKNRAFAAAESIKEITKEEAFEVLRKASEEGLVHSTRNTQDGIDYICNCCTCCCGLLRGFIEYGGLSAVGQSEFIARIDESLCSGCGSCLGQCHFQALEMNGDICRVRPENCFGCGLCVGACSTGALALKSRASEDTSPPPKSEADWRQRRNRYREAHKNFRKN